MNPVVVIGSETPLGKAVHAALERLPIPDGGARVAVVCRGAQDDSVRLDRALATDIDVLADLDDVKDLAAVVYLSRLSVVGQRRGLFPELDPRQQPFGAKGPRTGAALDLAAEVQALRDAVAYVDAISRHGDRVSRAAARATAELCALNGATTGRAHRERTEVVLARWRARDLARALVERAAGYGFCPDVCDALLGKDPDAHDDAVFLPLAMAARGYTRALGELLALGRGLPTTLLRVPAPLASAANGLENLEAPALSWLLDEVHRGLVRLPLDDSARLEALPQDLIVDAAVLAARAATASQAAPVTVVHVAAPDKAGKHSGRRVVELLDLHVRRGDRSPGARAPSLPLLALAVDTAPALAAPVGRALGTLSRVVDRAADAALEQGEALVRSSPLRRSSDVVPAAVKRLVDDARGVARSVVAPDDTVRALLSCAPFFPDDGRFSQRGLRVLAARAGVAAPGEPADLRRLLLDHHLPALDAARVVRERAQPPRVARPAWESLGHMLVEVAARYGNRTALSMFRAAAAGDDAQSDGEVTIDVSYAELLSRARAAALRLERAGVQAGDRVLLTGSNHPSWAIVALGALLLRAQLVPLDPNLPDDGVANIVKKARPRVAVVDKGVRARGKAFDGTLVERVLDLHLTAVSGPGIDAARPLPVGDDVASILFTSGTTGEPKGVVLTHANFCQLLSSLVAMFPVEGTDRLLSVLPLHHTFEFTCGLLLPLCTGARIYTPDALSGERVLFALKHGKITALVGVPALWQLLERRIRAQLQERSDAVQALFGALQDANRWLGKTAGVSLGRLAFLPVHQSLGGHLRILISGGSALPPAVFELFQSLGLPLAEGYGLTEAAPVLTVAAGVFGAEAGTVGVPIPGVTLRVESPDPHTGVGEVWAKGPNVMRGYFEDEARTKDVLDDGWLRTGDLGFLDEQGRLTLVGRQKDVVVTAAGENVYLDDTERRYEAIEGVKELVLFGIDDPRGGERLACVAVASDDSEAGRARAKDAIAARARKHSAVERPAVVELLTGPLPRTATLKVKRKDVKATLDAILAEREAASAAALAARGVVVRLSPVKQAIAQVAGVELARVVDTTHLGRDLGFDSLMWVELQSVLEPHFGALSAEALIQHETAAALERFLMAKRAGGDSAGGVVVDDTDRAAAPTESSSSSSSSSSSASSRSPGLLSSLPSFVFAPARQALSLAQREAYKSAFPTRVYGRSFIPQNRSCIVVANHTSHLDTGLVKFALGRYGAGLRPLAAKDYFFEGNAVKVAFFERLTNLVPIDRESGSGKAFEQARAVVEAGHVVLIFPEGTRQEDGVLKDFKPLVARLALATGVDVLPLHLEGAYEALPRDRLLPRLSSRRLVARIGPPLLSSELARLTAHLPAVPAARAAATVIHDAVAALRDGFVLDLASAPSLQELQQAKRRAPREAGVDGALDGVVDDATRAGGDG